MNENRTLIIAFLVILASGIGIFASIEIYDRYKSQQIINVLNEGAKELLNRSNARKEKYRLEKQQKETQRQAVIKAKARAKDQKRLIALAELKSRIKDQEFKQERRHGFEKWYEKNIPENCKPNYKMEEMTTNFVECTNHKMRSETAFNTNY